HDADREHELGDEPLSLLGRGRHHGRRLRHRGRRLGLLRSAQPALVRLLPEVPDADDHRRHPGVSMAIIELRNVSKRWGGTAAVERIDLRIDDGAFVAVLGPSGCGKTTALLMLAGIYNPSGGDIAFDGARVNDVEARDRNVGIVFQSYALYPNMTV